MTTFVQRLDLLRRPDETKKVFAKRIGVSPVQLSRYYGGTVPGWKVVKRISERTGASVEWLISGSRSEQENEPPRRRLGAKVSRCLSDGDLITIAVSYLEEIRSISREDREAFKELVLELGRRPEHISPLRAYLRFLRFEEKNKKNRILSPT